MERVIELYEKVAPMPLTQDELVEWAILVDRLRREQDFVTSVHTNLTGFHSKEA